MNEFTPYKVDNLELHKVNEMPENDLVRLQKLIFNDILSPEIILLRDKYYKEKGLEVIGRGANGIVYKFVGEDGYNYAVKMGLCDTKTNDGRILSKLQGVDGFVKLFHYYEGRYKDRTYEGFYVNFFVMISKMVKGFTIGVMIDDDNNYFNRSVFEKESRPDIIEVLNKSIEHIIDRDLFPSDMHEYNMMFDTEEGLLYFIDVGAFDIKPPIYQIDNVKGFVFRSCGLRYIFGKIGNVKNYVDFEKVVA